MANAGVRGRPIVSLVLSAQERAVSFRCFVVGKRPYERPQPPALLDSVGRPEAVFEISVFGTARRTGAQPAVQCRPPWRRNFPTAIGGLPYMHLVSGLRFIGFEWWCWRFVSAAQNTVSRNQGCRLELTISKNALQARSEF